MAILGFRNKATAEIAARENTKESRRVLPLSLHGAARKKLQFLHAARDLKDLSALRGLRLEGLKGDRIGQFCIRINDQYRICFLWEHGNATQVEIVDYH